MQETTQINNNIDDCVEQIIEKVGKDIVLALPLGLGKANHLANALFQRAEKDPQLHLHIVTALTLEAPTAGDELSQRFLEPFAERVYRSYPELLYAKARREDRLPSNVRVSEFFFNPGKLLKNPIAQRHYFCSNYTHATRDLLALGVNVVTQMISPHPQLHTRYSLSCNPDVTFDLINLAKNKIFLVGQVNQQLPYLPGQAEVDEGFFDLILRTNKNDEEPINNFPLFVIPPTPVALSDYAIAIHVASLIKDGGTLQIGIGALGDAIAHVLTLRHSFNHFFQSLLKKCQNTDQLNLHPNLPSEHNPFEQGLYATSEMLVEGLMYLHEHGILKRKVYPDAGVQKLINQGKIKDQISVELIYTLIQERCIHIPLQDQDVRLLQTLGCLDEDVTWHDGDLHHHNGEVTSAQTQDAKMIINLCAANIDKPLGGGTYCHAGFYIGSSHFYQQLRALKEDSYLGLNMCSVHFTNQLYGDEKLKRSQRLDARFVNTGMMATLDGAIISDGLKNTQVVSGVGGQYNFVAQAHELEGGRSIICIHSTRTHNGKVESNILWDYPHTTIPRHLRDVVVTEYGVADLRGQSDRDVIVRMLAITDSRFQPELLTKAQRAYKIEKDYQIPESFKHNYPHTLQSMLLGEKPIEGKARAQQHFPYFPLGTEFTQEEMSLAIALKSLKQSGTNIQRIFPLCFKGWKNRYNGRSKFSAELKRMSLLKTTGVREWFYQLLLLGVLNEIDNERPLLNTSDKSN